VNCVAFKPDNPNIVVSGSDDETIKTWDITSGSCLSTLNVDSQVLSVAYSPDGTKLTAALGYPSYSVVVFDTQTNEQIRSLSGHNDFVNSISFSPDGKRLASGSDDNTVKIWNPATGECLWTVSGEDPIHCVAFSPDGSLLAAGDGYSESGLGEVRIYNASTGDPVGSP